MAAPDETMKTPAPSNGEPPAKFPLWGLVTVLVLSWALPLFALYANLRDPDYNSALGVAYGFMIGCALHFIFGLIWIGIRRSKMRRIEWIVLLVSFGVLVVFTVFADHGHLSRVAMV